MMKAIQILIVTLLLSKTVLSQVVIVDQVPPAVKKVFQSKFPAVNRVEWKIKSFANYEAEFTLKGTDIAVKFDSTGKWLEAESAASWSMVPSAVKDTFTEWFKGYKDDDLPPIRQPPGAGCESVF
jgi:Putative beta-lactamase-inhibitor-like, PepSY-like